MADKFTSGRIDTHEYLAKLAENSLTAEQIQDIVNYKVQEKLGRYTHTYGHQLTVDDFYEEEEGSDTLVCNLPIRNDIGEVFLITTDVKQALVTQYPNATSLKFKMPDGNEYVSVKLGALIQLYAPDEQGGFNNWIHSASAGLYNIYVTIKMSAITSIGLYWHPLSDSLTVDLLSEW